MKNTLILATSALALSLSLAHADTLAGNDLANSLVGSTAASSIDGKGGNDILWGEPGSVMGPLKAMTFISRADDVSTFENKIRSASFSPDGTKVAFAVAQSFQSGSNYDCYVKDLKTGTLTLVSSKKGVNSVAGDKLAGVCNFPQFTADGKAVAFLNNDPDALSNITFKGHNILLKNLITGELSLLSTNTDGAPFNNVVYSFNLSRDGRKLAFATSSTNLIANDSELMDVYVKDLTTGAIIRASQTAAGVAGDSTSVDPVLSPDGTKLSFTSHAKNLVANDTNNTADIFVKDLATGAIKRATTKTDGTEQMGGSNISGASFSPDGSWLYFESSATNLTTNDNNQNYDVFGKNLITGELIILTKNANGEVGSEGGRYPFVSPDGTKVVFSADSANLFPGFSGNGAQSLMKDLKTGKFQQLSVGLNGAMSNSTSDIYGVYGQNVFSPDGKRVIFESYSSNLVSGDTDDSPDVFMVELADPTGASDVIKGGLGNDRLYGLVGDDILAGGPGGDLIDGGAGSNTADYGASASPVTIDLAKRIASGGDATGDQLVNIANLTGSAKDDKLTGSAAANRLYGNRGKDTLTGGGAGDRFVYRFKSESLPTASDLIVDFKPGEGDKIDLSAVDAKSGTTKNEAFTYIDTKSFGGKKGQLRFNKAKSRLEADINGDKKADLIIRLNGVTGVPKSGLIL